MAWPHTFGNQTGSIPLSDLDDNFNSAVFATSGTGSALLPTGTTAQRDTSPTQGGTRYNTTNGVLEYYDGTAWQSVSSESYVSNLFEKVNVQFFTASGTYTPSANMCYCRVEVLGAGGGGGGASAGSSNASCGGGGGAGGYAVGVYSSTQIGASQSVTIGAGGGGGSTSGGSGSTGGTSSVGALVSGSGGVGGSGGGSGAGSGGAQGGVSGASSGSSVLATRQGAGGLAWWPNASIGQSGFGGSSIYGQGGQSQIFSANGGGYAGQAGAGYGSGGSGACASNGNASGGAGANGLVVITEYIGA